MTELACFGDPSRFEVAVRWLPDHEPRERRPAHGGWSMGELRLTVRNHVLTRHEFNGTNTDSVHWYLLPFFEWLASNWVELLHEERFAWREKHAVPAATAVFIALRRLIVTHSEQEQEEYANVQRWWQRHALRAADSSALFPDLVVRRLMNDIEMSWTARQPSHLPDGYRFVLVPGAATLPVSEVATPLWEALAWAVSTPPDDLRAADHQSIAELERKIEQLQSLDLATLEQGYLPSQLFNQIEHARRDSSAHGNSIRMTALPALMQLNDDVLMFGGVSPDINTEDTRTLLGLLAKQVGGQDSDKLADLIDTTIGVPLAAPFEEGYDLAENLLDDLNLEDETAVLDVPALMKRLDIRVIETNLHTSTIRGVAIAGDGYHPAILVNLASAYNAEERGRRFTLAHEFFHILYDRTRARRIAHSSGPWAPPGIEKRANAFAAMLLMPRHLVQRRLQDTRLDCQNLFQMAGELQVGATALLEHLFNIDIIDESTRDQLRTELITTGTR